MVTVAIVSFRDVAYWGYPSAGTWHFTQINGTKHFRAEKLEGPWWRNYEDQEDVKGVDMGNNDVIYSILRRASR